MSKLNAFSTPTPAPYWLARVTGHHVLIQDDTGRLWSLTRDHPDIWTVAIWIRNRPGVRAMAKIDPFTDVRHTRMYDEYRFITFPF